MWVFNEDAKQGSRGAIFSTSIIAPLIDFLLVADFGGRYIY